MARIAQGPAIFDDASRSPTKTSVFRSLLSSKGHKRNQSADDASRSQPYTSQPSTISLAPVEQSPSHSNQQPLGEIVPNHDASDNGMFYPISPTKPRKGGLHKKTKSAVSLKSLKNYMERKDSKSDKASDDSNNKPKKAKSTNSFTAILKRSQHGRKTEELKDIRDKENRSPFDPADNLPSPVWAQYETSISTPTPSFRDEPSSPVRSNRRRTLQEEVSLYTPKGYSPAQQRNFYDFHQPSLTSRNNPPKPRPKSDYFIGGSKMKDLFGPFQSNKQTQNDAPGSPSSSKDRGRPRGLSSPDARPELDLKPPASPKKASRVQEVISAFNAKEREAELQKRLNAKDLENEFEKLLDARNIPHNMRDKMRSLDTNIKADFIEKDKIESAGPHSAGASSYAAEGSGRRGRGKEKKEDHDSYDSKGSRSRSRSRGFTFRGNSSSPSKKPRPESGGSHRRPKSADFGTPNGLSKILTPSTSTTSLAATARHDTATDPSDFVHYLKEIQKPEIIEVGKVHKLRILLRNETVSWVDSFIADGGMDEIVQLVYRIMKVEWREEHEDNLLHETLLCLKALCTTSVALQRLTSIEAELFPALLRMLFDKDKKGPSEFTTRGIIINLIFTQLSTAVSSEDAASRARRILSYLKDPEEEIQPLSFIANIYQSRPYRVWCKEVSNVTKEVFWIFLHHLNVIPVVESDKSSSESYRERHFPAPRPPVPAAPYVGGVEWDATNYLASHIDLLNAIIACLPTGDERNQLRSELRASGFEKVMGGTLRTCKEKFYSAVHDCLRTWVSAAVEDEWPHLMVREGPPRQDRPPSKSPIKASPKKSALADNPPKLDLALDLPPKNRASQSEEPIGNWL
ncbi:armadillo-type protein [Aspergillus pseudoustus]|uniref:Armadillo-type protein n=1 Tax=Aspergillus pseudoustus TaxID=1810923 RepID=A0ABR4KMF6_9EURO